MRFESGRMVVDGINRRSVFGQETKDNSKEDH